MSELTDYIYKIPTCVVINLTDMELGLIKNAEYMTKEQLLTSSDIIYDIIIVVTDTDIELPNLAAHSESDVKLLIYPAEIEQAVFNQQHDFYNGVIQCEPALTTALLKDIIEPITTDTLICSDCGDLRLFFSANKEKISYQRLPIAKNTCPPLTIPNELNKPNEKVHALLILSCILSTKMELIEDIDRKVIDTANFTRKGMLTRDAEFFDQEYSDHRESQALGILFITLL